MPTEYDDLNGPAEHSPGDSDDLQVTFVGFAWHIVVAGICCQPLGTVSLVLLAMSDSYRRCGDVQQARKYRNQSDQFFRYAIWLGLMLWVTAGTMGIIGEIAGSP